MTRTNMALVIGMKFSGDAGPSRSWHRSSSASGMEALADRRWLLGNLKAFDVVDPRDTE